MSVLQSGPLAVSGTLTTTGDSLQFPYKVVCSAPTDTLLSVCDHVRTTYGHGRGSLLPGGRYYCEKVTADQGKDGLVWIVTAVYQNVQFTGAAQAVTPLNEPWGITATHTSKRDAFAKAYSKWVSKMYDNGMASETPVAPGTAASYAVLNSMNQPFDPPWEKERRLLVLNLTKNISVATYNSVKPLELDDTLNNNNVTIAGRLIPKWAGLLTVEATRRFYFNDVGTLIFYMAMSYSVTLNLDLWAVRLVDQGLTYKKYSEPGKDSIVAATTAGMRSQREPKPVLLNGLGYALRDANEGANPKGVAAFISFFDKREATWSPLDLPASVTTE